MTETIEVPVTPAKSRRKIVWIALPVLFLLLAYGSGIAIFPGRIQTSFQQKNCVSVLSLHGLYTRLYPAFIQDTSVSAQVQECESFTSAVTSEENEQWQEAFEAYQAYASKYPNGIYARDVYERSAAALVNVVKDQANGQQYAAAMKNLDLIITGFSDTKASVDAWTLTPEVYTSWGSSLRNAGDFEEAERVLKEFRSWGEHYQRNEAVPGAKRELAKTYIAWGQALQSEGNFEAATAKLELASSIDPDSDPAMQRTIYLAWGDALLKAKDFSAAVEKFETAVARSNGANEDGVNDALANGYVQWAHDLSTSEDYFAALERLDKAQASVITDEMNESVDAALQETYLAFSMSTGSQAKQAMKDAVQALCEKREEPDLPIFGLNKDVVRVGVFGLDDPLPENLAAKSPGEMHFIACIEADSRTVDSRYQRYILQRTSMGYYYTVVQQFRAQVLWNINLFPVDTLKSIGKTTLEGGMPPPFPDGTDHPGGYFYGSTPTMDQLSEWLQSVMMK